MMLRMGDDFVDYKNLKLSDVDLNCISSNAAATKKFGRISTNPER